MSDRNENQPLDFGQSYRKAADYCAIQDRCYSEIRYKLKYWNIDRSYTEEIIEKLTEEDFLNEKRFAVNYAGGKFRMNGWGRIKITSELKMKSISADLIFEALETIEEEEYIAFLKEILGKKMRLLGSNTIANRQKAAFYAASKGFEPSLINSILKNTNFTD